MVHLQIFTCICNHGKNRHFVGKTVIVALMNKQIKPVYVSGADALMHVHTHARTRSWENATHTTYQLVVGVNCVGPQGKNNIAPKTDRQTVCSVFQQPTPLYEDKITQSCYNHTTHCIFYPGSNYCSFYIKPVCIMEEICILFLCLNILSFPIYRLYLPVIPKRQCFHDYVTVNC